MRITPGLCVAFIAITAAVTLPVSAAPKVAVVLKDRAPFWTAVESGAQAAAKQAGADLVVKAPFHINSIPEHLRLLGGLKDQSLDALVIGPHPTTEPYRAPLAEFVAKGVKIVCIEDVPNGLDATLVSYDQTKMAEDAANQLAATLQPTDVVGLLRGNTTSGTQSPREVGLLAALKKSFPNIKVFTDVMTGFESGDEEAQAKVLLQRHPEVTVVITPYTAQTHAVMKILAQSPKRGAIRHLGFGSGFAADVKQAIESGVTSIYVAQLPQQIGRKAVEVALALARGESVPKSVSVEYVIVTKANVSDPRLAE